MFNGTRTFLGRSIAHNTQSESSTRPGAFLALYRALLRQATYLPDPAAREYIRQHIIARFRVYNPRKSIHGHTGKSAGKNGLNPSYQNATLGRTQSDRRERWSMLWIQGSRALHRLERANLGCRTDLLRVLFHTYGRSGKRRHELLEQLKHGGPESVASDVVSGQLSAFPDFPPNVAEKLPRLSHKLEALLRSQQRAKLHFSTRSKIKLIDPVIPKQNIWLRPTPVKRVANLVRRWYAEKLDQVLPPLPPAEWERLGELARGERRWEGPIIPRKRCDVVMNLTYREHGELTMKSSRASSVLHQSLGLEKSKTTWRENRPHALTDRYMRQLYLRIFSICARMNWDEQTNSWIVEWGSAKPRRPRFTVKLQNLLLQESFAP